MRDEENGGGTAQADPGPSPDQSPDEPPLLGSDVDSGDENLLDRAEALVDAGRFTEAESLYASAVVARTDVDAMTQYSRFLRRSGRLDLAATMSDRLYDVGRSRGDTRAMIEALSNRAIISRKRGQNAGSIRELERAISIARDAGPEYESELAFLLDNVGLTLRKQGELSSALTHHLEALAIKRRLDDPKSLATTLNHTAALLRQSGRLDEALEMTQEAVADFRQLGYDRGEAQAHANLGELYEDRGELEAARAEYQESLDLNEKLRSPEGIGMNLWQLGRLSLMAGNLGEAQDYAASALNRSRAEGMSRPEAIGAPLQLLGNIRTAQGRYDEAIEDLELAAEIFERNGHALGGAWSRADLAVAQFHAGDLSGATESVARAEAGRDLQHRKFQTVLASVRDLVHRQESEGPQPPADNPGPAEAAA